MEKENSGTSKKSPGWFPLVLIAGIAIATGSCLSMLGSVYLDMLGKQAAGELRNVAVCSAGENCWTAQVKFKADNGNEITIHPLQGRWPFAVNQIVQAGAVDDDVVEVRYLENSPRWAKISLAYHVEYVNRLTWLFWGSVVAFFGWAMNRRKPIVLDLSRS